MAGSNFLRRTPLNILMNVTRTVVMALVGILLVPYYIDTLGMASYGIIPLATTMSSYVMILTDSLGSACSRYSTIDIHNKDDASDTLSTGFFGILRICMMLIPVVVLISVASPYIFGVDDNSDSEVQIMFLLVLGGSLITALTSAYTPVFNAFNTLYNLYAARLVYTFVQVGIVVVMFSFGTPSLEYVGLAYFVSPLFLITIVAYLAKRAYPVMRMRHSLYDKSLFKKMSALGAGAVAMKIGDMLYISASLVIINIILGSEAEAGFAVVSSLVSMIHTACYSVTTSFEPLIYDCYAEHDDARMAGMMRTGLKFVALMFAMPVAFLIVFAPEVLTAWVGAERAYLAEIARIALVGDVIYCAVTIMFDIPIAYLKIGKLARLTLAFGITNVVCAVCVAAFTDYGVEGVTVVWMLCTLAYMVSTLLFDERIVGTPRFHFLKPVLFGTAVMFGCAALMWGLSEIIDLPGSWLYVIPLFFVLYGIYLLVMFKVLLRKEEKEMASKFLPGQLQRLFSVFM